MERIVSKSLAEKDAVVLTWIHRSPNHKLHSSPGRHSSTAVKCEHGVTSVIGADVNMVAVAIQLDIMLLVMPGLVVGTKEVSNTSKM